MEKANLLANSTSVIAIVVGIVCIAIIVAVLLLKGQLRVKSEKLSIESVRRDTKSLLAECRTSASLLSREFAEYYIQKYPHAKYQILYISELCLNRVDKILQYNNVSTNEDYIRMRYIDVKAIIDSNRIEGADYSEEFYDKLYEEFSKMLKQIVMLKKHYGE